MPDYFDGPHGRIRVPDALVEPTYATDLTAQPIGDEVNVQFIKLEIDPAGSEDGAVAEVVSNVFMSRDRFEQLVGDLPAALEAWRERGL